MQPLKSFNSNLGTAILITGGAGVGKTVLAMRLWPKSYVFVADLNFKSGKDYLEKICKSSNIVGFDTATPDEDGKPVPPALRYPRMMNKISAAIESKDVDVIILDSATFIEDIIKARICNATSDANVRLEGFKQWGDLVITWKSIILQLRQSGKKLIMIAHENKERDESDGIYKYQIAVDGSTQPTGHVNLCATQEYMRRELQAGVLAQTFSGHDVCATAHGETSAARPASQIA